MHHRLSSCLSLCLILCLVSAGLGGQTLRPRPQVHKPEHVELDHRIHRGDVIHLKFKDGLYVRLDRGRLVDGGTGSLPAGNLLSSLLAGAQIRRTYTLSDARLQQLRLTAQANLGKAVADLRLCFDVVLRGVDDSSDLINSLNQLACVEYALPMLRPAPLPVAAPDFSAMQDYLLSAPVGVDAPNAWATTGGTGQGIKICDVEYGWTLSHLDLPNVTLLGPAPVNPFSDDHGTAVLGEMAGLPDGIGVTGISYGADFFVAAANTANGYNPGAAIITSLNTLGDGDIILIEQQVSGPTGDYCPIEWFLPYYNAIVTAVGNGVSVIEAAGNGGVNLDGPSFQTGNSGHYPFMATNDSGAIIVGAGASQAGSQPNHSRLNFSCYGSTVDMQGQGERVTTTGYGNLYSAGGIDEEYTQWFNGTSSASPIVAGAAAIVQGVHKAITGSPMSPSQLKSILQATGTPQVAGSNPVSQNIGPFPNADAAVNMVLASLSAAVVSSLSPDEVPVGSSGFSLTVSGENFDGASKVYFDGVPLTTIVMSPQQMIGIVPASLLQNRGFFDVTADSSTSSESMPVPFHVRGPYLSQEGAGINVIRINGSDGGTDRRVDVGVLQPLMIEVLQPATNPQPAHFTIYGMFGVPDLSNVFTFPGINGTMAITACPFDPGNPLLFNMFTTIGLFDPCGAVTTGPGHLQFGTSIGLPDPLLITLQGVIERSPGVWEFTNGVILNVE